MRYLTISICASLGQLIGTRTWGGLVGTLGIPPPTIDGGGITAPSLAFYDPNRQMGRRNQGRGAGYRGRIYACGGDQGHDPQLERAVQEALKLLEQNPSSTSSETCTDPRRVEAIDW